MRCHSIQFRNKAYLDNEVEESVYRERFSQWLGLEPVLLEKWQARGFTLDDLVLDGESYR